MRGHPQISGSFSAVLASGSDPVWNAHLVTLPMRVSEDPELVEMLKEYNRKKKIYVMTHVNHPKELTDETEAGCRAAD